MVENDSMKRVLAIGAFIAVFSMAFVACQSMGESDSPSQEPEGSEKVSTASVLGVEEFMRNVEQYRQGSVTVEGVVSTVNAENQLVGLIDTREFQECKVTTCSALTLPIHWSGSMPKVQEMIQVKGKLQEKDGRFVFLAQKMERQG